VVSELRSYTVAGGFLVIESTHSLDVTTVYTAGKLRGEVESIAVEQIRERKNSPRKKLGGACQMEALYERD